MKFLSRRTHGVADYLLVVVFLSLPTALGVTGAPRVLAYALAFAHLLVTGLSSFPPGGLPIISFRVHAIIEALAGLVLILSPWLLHFADVLSARSSFLILGAVLLILAAFTNFERRKARVAPPPGDRRRRYSRRSR